ncbi:MAG TPA: GNAT family N-acetyltransferase [Candidatus Dormibacteraeota bacterium]|nr:GNAT family N-acetyltransferase [Candidatus Dormibacteraeota bacterium]
MGKGYATEIVSYVITSAFEALAIKKIVAETQTAHIRFKKLLERLERRN